MKEAIPQPPHSYIYYIVYTRLLKIQSILGSYPSMVLRWLGYSSVLRLRSYVRHTSKSLYLGIPSLCVGKIRSVVPNQSKTKEKGREVLLLSHNYS